MHSPKPSPGANTGCWYLGAARGPGWRKPETQSAHEGIRGLKATPERLTHKESRASRSRVLVG